MSYSNNDALLQSKTEVDQGLRQYMNGIYARMSAGVLVTAVMAFAVGSSPALFNLVMGGPQAYVFIFAPAIVVWFGFNPVTMSAAKLQGSFFLISALYGVSFAGIAVMATHQPGYVYDVARAFFITVGMFAGLSIYGYTTKRDLSGMRQFLVMGMWGVLILGIMSFFVKSSGFSMMISAIAIPVFAGMTVWKTQELKQMYLSYRGSGSLDRVAWAGALTLYISFIALFMHILNLLSRR